jgi:hypothetical protein
MVVLALFPTQERLISLTKMAVDEGKKGKREYECSPFGNPQNHGDVDEFVGVNLAFANVGA